MRLTLGRRLVNLLPVAQQTNARVVKGMDWKPIVISRAGSCPADDAICEGISLLGYWQEVNQSSTQSKSHNNLNQSDIITFRDRVA